MSLGAILAVGFFLGMRHATDADHVVAVSAIVSRQRTWLAAAPIGILWGLGHTITILLVGGGIILFGIVVPPRVGLAMELSVAVMLVLLGGVNVFSVLKDARAIADAHRAGRAHPHAHSAEPPRSMRPLLVGIVHGLAGSAAVALLVLGAIGDALWAAAYLLVFGVGTIAGMMLITTALAVPVAAAAQRFGRLHHALGIVTGVASIVLGSTLAYDIGFVHGGFTEHPRWTPR